jgi:glycerophosphoryl diester phosphodiesterase
MSQLAKAFGKKFVENKDIVRTRQFELGSNTFKVKIPLTVEYEAIMEKVKVVDETKLETYYAEITKPLTENKDTLTADMQVEFKDNDIIVQGRSMRDTAKNKLITENRILAMIQMLVPEEKGFDMSTVTYDMVEELFPFSIQLELVDKISETISPSYGVSKGK